jgi:hypothetical protein
MVQEVAVLATSIPAMPTYPGIQEIISVQALSCEWHQAQETHDTCRFSSVVKLRCRVSSCVLIRMNIGELSTELEADSKDDYALVTSSCEAAMMLFRERAQITVQIYLLDIHHRGSYKTVQGTELDAEESKLFTLPNSSTYSGMEWCKGYKICLCGVMVESLEGTLPSSDSVRIFFHPPWERNIECFGGQVGDRLFISSQHGMITKLHLVVITTILPCSSNKLSLHRTQDYTSK